MKLAKKQTLDRLDYLILDALRRLKALNMMYSYSIQDLQEDLDYVNRTTIWKHLQILIDYGYVKEGGKSARRKTYYITLEGQSIIEGCELSNDETY